MQGTKKKRAQRYVETKPGRVARYRRIVPLELRARFGGKAEFVRSLKTMSYEDAHHEFETLARGGAAQVQPVAPEWPPEFDLSYLRYLAETGGDVAGRADELERLARTLRSNIALGVSAEGEAVAAKLERLVRQARGEKVAPVVTLKTASERFLTTITAPGTLKQYKPRLADIVAVLGERRDIREITRAECREFAQTTIYRIPGHWRKRWPNLTIQQAMKRGEAEGADAIKYATLDGYVMLLRRFFAWALAEGLIEANPAADAPSPKGKKGKRSDFSPAQLKTIFTNAPYKPDQRKAEPGMFWLPLLGLFTGARRDELVMLRRDDLKVERGVTFLDFREFDGRSLKTSSSVRQVPLHPTLIKIGLMKYAATLKDGWLFPDLHNAKKPGDAFGKRYGRHLDALGIDDDALTFHSFRHTFSTGARESGIEKAMRDRIGGWAAEGAAEGYGQYTLQTLAREVGKLHYEVDLSHLCRRGG
jgi:integrase